MPQLGVDEESFSDTVHSGWLDGDMKEELSSIGYVQAQVAEHLPGLNRAVAEIRKELGAYVGLVHPSAHRGVNLLTVQTVNDFSDLLADIGMGRGRPAIRGLRSIFESLVTMLDIASGTDAADRYEEHYAVVRYQAATMKVALTGLAGNDLRAENHRRRKQQRTYRKAHDEAIAKRGRSFERTWSDESLQTRAARHGYTKDYDLYRVLSSSVHVAAGGARGVERRYDETPVYRFGPDLLNCPLALSEGLRYFVLFVEALADQTGIPAERLISTLTGLEALIGAYRRLIWRIDGDLWPDNLPIGMIVVRALLPDGQRRWILHDNQQQRIIACSDPKNATQEQIESAERLLDTVEDTHRNRDEWITVALVQATADPLTRAKWRSDGHLVPLDWNPHGLMFPWDQ